MTIQPIVEGHGEVSAVPVLLRRFQEESGAYGLSIGKPIRRKRTELVLKEPLRKAVRLALLQPDCGAILILFDSDDDCPKELAPTLQGWANEAAGTVPCAVVMAHREYEAWFLASIESLRGKRGIREDAMTHASPETPRDAKGQLEDHMVSGRSYSETADQAALTALFDMAAAYSQCRSFKRMTDVFGLLATSIGARVADWPPPSWAEEHCDQ